MKNIFLLLVVACSAKQVTAQNNLDSLYKVWQDDGLPDSIRVKAYDDYIWDGFVYSNPDSAFILAKRLLEYGERKDFSKAKTLAYNIQGVSFWLKGNYPRALDCYKQGLKIVEQMGNKGGIAVSLNNIGLIYADQSNYLSAISYYQRSLKIREEIDDKGGVANSLGNIGTIYNYQENYDLALSYYQRSLKLNEELGFRNKIANCLSNIGGIYSVQKNFSKGLEYYERSLKIQEETRDKSGLAVSLNNIGNIKKDQGSYNQALDYYQRGLSIRQEIGDKRGVANSLNNIGSVFNKQGKFEQGIVKCKAALELSEEIGAIMLQKISCQCLYDSYKSLGRGNEALLYIELMRLAEDSLNAEETVKKLQQMEFAKQMLQDSIAQVEADRLVEEAHQEEVRQKNRTRNIFGGVGFFALLLAGGFFWRWRYVQQSKATLQVEKDRSENLLLNILPADIAAELKEKGRADARDFEMVSILFTDFKGFTAASEKLSAQELVAEINTCFEAFDGIIGKYNIEKIKTIGDAYMAAGGLPVPTDDSVKNTVLAALEMQAFISTRKAKLDAEGKPCFEMRVGVHTGPVVAGIVGVKKFQYDIWGDTVNTASRMESSGEVGKVNISEATYELLKNDPAFTFESRGKVEAKGKGEMEMYFVSQKGYS